MLKQKQNKITLGITGCLGSGKSTVAGIFKSWGAKIVDADKIAHSCMRKGSPAYRKIVAFFGKGILNRSKEINRAKLGDLVFSKAISLKKLEGIVHPQVISKIRTKIKKIKKGVVILDAPLLLEAGLRSVVDKIIVVKLKRKMQIKRLSKKGNYSQAKIKRIIESQIPLREKMRVADFIIDNNGKLSETKKQVLDIRRKVWKS